MITLIEKGKLGRKYSLDSYDDRDAFVAFMQDLGFTHYDEGYITTGELVLIFLYQTI